MRRLSGIAVIALLCWCHAASAGLVVMDLKFTGIDFAIADGATSDVTFRVSFDSSAADTNPSANVGEYAGTLTLLSGGSTSEVAPAVVTISNNVDDGVGNIIDEFHSSAAFTTTLATVDGRQVNNADVRLISSAANMFSDDALPLDVGFAAQATTAIPSLQDVNLDTGEGFGPYAAGQFEVLPVVSVPEPSAFALLVAGLAGIFTVRRARRS